MPNPDGAVCSNCKFWVRMQPNEGDCRRYPPRNFLVGLANSPVGQQPAFTSAFPRIRGDLSCGEHKQKIELH